ncbi:MAG: beta-glycosidase, partial [Sphingobacteriaceae bacterium]
MKSVMLFLTGLFLINTIGFSQTIVFTINPKNKAQTIDNFGASGAWFSEGIGKYWPVEKKERMAELLFSKGFDAAGNPLGIGLSAWRFNIGGGTAEQGESSGISNPVKRVECFLSPNGNYNWQKQQGYVWFVKKAAAYGVTNLIAFSNTPPVQFTKNGLGFKTEKNYEANLKDNQYVAYADFLAAVVQHFDREGLRFNYISPVNEPQWDWSNAFGKMNQEGSPWHNENIFKITSVLDSILSVRKISAKIITPEAGALTALYEGKGQASRQIQNLYGKNSKYYVGNLKHVQQIIAG